MGTKAGNDTGIEVGSKRGSNNCVSLLVPKKVSYMNLLWSVLKVMASELKIDPLLVFVITQKMVEKKGKMWKHQWEVMRVQLNA